MVREYRRKYSVIHGNYPKRLTMDIVKLQRFFRSLASSGVVLATSSAVALGFPFNQTDKPEITAHSYSGNVIGDLILEASGLGLGHDALIRLHSKDDGVSISISQSSEKLKFSVHKNQFEYRYVFMRAMDEHRFVLLEVTRQKLGKLFDSIEDGSLDEPNAGPPSRKESTTKAACVDRATSQVNNVLWALSKNSSCGDYVSDLAALAEPYSDKNSVKDNSPIACMKRIEAYAGTAFLLQRRIVSGSNLNFTCSTSAKSNFNQISSTLNFGPEVLRGSIVNRQRAFLHEFLHASEIKSEQEVNGIVDCCADPASNKSQCTLADLYGRARERSDSVLARFATEAVSNSNIADRPKLKSLLDEDDEFNMKANCDKATKLAAAARLNSSIDAFCASSNSPACKTSIGDLRTSIQVRVEFGNNTGGPNCKHVARNANVGTVAGTASADPSAKASASPQSTVPQTLVYKPETTEPAAVRREVERIRQPLMAAREYGGTVARTIVASMGNTAYAANSSLPRRISKTEWTSTVKSVDPKSGRVTLDLGTNERGQQITASASIPFDGSQFSAPQVDVRVGSAHLSDSTTSNRALAGAPATRVEISDSTLQDAGASRASVPGRLPRGGAPENRQANSAGGPEAPGATNYSGGGAESSPPSATRDSAPTRSVADAPSISSSVLKRMLVRSNSPEAIIRDHLDDLKSNSMQVRFRCVWYPQNFKGTQLFDLDAYQGRKCGSQ
jgi:hypothetical protein